MATKRFPEKKPRNSGRADGEQHRQVIKDNAARVHHQRQMEFIAESQQQARSGKQRNRQH